MFSCFSSNSCYFIKLTNLFVHKLKFYWLPIFALITLGLATANAADVVIKSNQSGLLIQATDTESIGVVTVNKDVTISASDTLKAAVKLEATATEAKIRGLTINGTADGSQQASNYPALLITSTSTYNADLTISSSITISNTGMLTTSGTSGLYITKIGTVTADIYNQGTITGSPAIQIGEHDKLTGFILAGSLTNTGIIKAKPDTGYAMVLAGSKTTAIDSFKITNSGTIDGNLKFVADTSDFNYSLTNSGTITAAKLEVKDASLTLTNTGLLKAANFAEVIITATTKTSLSASSVTIGSLKNAALGEVTLTNSKITKLLENQHGTVTFTSQAIIQEATNSGVIFAKNGLEAQGKFTNTQSGSICIAGETTFKGDVSNQGTITQTDNSEKFTLGNNSSGSNYKLSNSGYIKAGEFVSYHSIENQPSGYMRLDNGLSLYKMVVNDGTMEFTNDYPGFHEDSTNTGTMLAKGLHAYKKFTNTESGSISIANHKATFEGETTNQGYLVVDRGLKATGKFTNSQAGSITIAGAEATFSGVATNTGRLTAKADLILKNTAKFTNEGTLNVAGNFNIAKQAEFIFNNGSVIFNIINNEGSFTANKAFTIAKNSKFTNAGTLTVTGKFNIAKAATFVLDAGTATFNKKITNAGNFTSKLPLSLKDKFTNLKDAIVTVKGQLTFNKEAVNLGTINANSLIAKGKLTNLSKDSIIVDGKAEVSRTENKGKMALGSLIVTNDKFTNYPDSELTVNNKFAIYQGAEFINNSKNVTFKGLTTNSGSLTSSVALTLTKLINNQNATIAVNGLFTLKTEASNSGTIIANVGLRARGKFTNSKSGMLEVIGAEAVFNASATNAGTIITKNGFALTNKESLFINSGTLDIHSTQHNIQLLAKLDNQQGATLNAYTGKLMLLGIATNSGKIFAKGDFEAHQNLVNRSKAHLEVIGDLRLVVGATNAGSIIVHKGLFAKENFTNSVGAKVTIASKSADFQNLENSGEINAEKGLNVFGSFNNNVNAKVIVANNRAVFSKTATNSGEIIANAGLLVNDKFINLEHGDVRVAKAAAEFKASVENAGSIVANHGLKIQTAKFINKGTLTIKGEFDIAKKAAFEHNGELRVNDWLNNSGSFKASKQIAHDNNILYFNNQIVAAKAEFSNIINDPKLYISNQGNLLLAASSTIGSYLGKELSELVLTLPTTAPNNTPLVTVANHAVFKANSKIILTATQALAYLQNGSPTITILQAQKVDATEGVGKLLHGEKLTSGNVLINITNAEVSVNSITAKLETVSPDSLDLKTANRSMLTSLLAKNIVSAKPAKQASADQSISQEALNKITDVVNEHIETKFTDNKQHLTNTLSALKGEITKEVNNLLTTHKQGLTGTVVETINNKFTDNKQHLKDALVTAISDHFASQLTRIEGEITKTVTPFKDELTELIAEMLDDRLTDNEQYSTNALVTAIEGQIPEALTPFKEGVTELIEILDDRLADNKQHLTASVTTAVNDKLATNKQELTNALTKAVTAILAPSPSKEKTSKVSKKKDAYYYFKTQVPASAKFLRELKSDSIANSDEHSIKTEKLMSNLYKVALENANHKDIIIKLMANASKQAASAEEFIDLLLPDNSNAHIEYNHKANIKMVSNIHARLFGQPGMNTANNQRMNLYGINSGYFNEIVRAWGSFSYQASKNTKQVVGENSYKIDSLVYNFGVDTTVNNGMILGIAYAYETTKQEIHGTVKKKASDDINSYAFAVYASNNDAQYKLDAVFIFITNAHKYLENPNSTRNMFKSNTLSFNTRFTHPVRQFNLKAQLGVARVSIDGNCKKLSPEEPADSTALTLGTGVDFNIEHKIDQFTAINLNCGLDYIYLASEKPKDAEIRFTGTSLPAIPYKKADISKHNLQLNSIINLKIQQGLIFDLKLGYGLTEKHQNYQATFVVHYKF